jgi:high-affinity iron transporter
MRFSTASLPVALVLLGLTSVAVAGSKMPTKRPSDADRGEELYLRHCVQCHGPTGAGNGPAAAAMVRPVPDLRGKLDKANRELQVSVVMKGRGAMPGFGTSFDEHDARRLLKYFETLAVEGAPLIPEPPVEEPEPVEEDEDDAPDGEGQ